MAAGASTAFGVKTGSSLAAVLALPRAGAGCLPLALWGWGFAKTTFGLLLGLLDGSIAASQAVELCLLVSYMPLALSGLLEIWQPFVQAAQNATAHVSLMEP